VREFFLIVGAEAPTFALEMTAFVSFYLPGETAMRLKTNQSTMSGTNLHNAHTVLRRAARRRSDAVSDAIQPLEKRVLFSFVPGDVVVYTVGTGSALSSAAAPVTLSDYSTSGTLNTGNSVSLPTAVSGTNNPLTASGTGGNEGSLSLSSNGQYLVVPGYDAIPGTASVATTQAGTSGYITKVTAANPIVVSTPSTAGMTVGDSVTISNVGGISAANGTFTITALTGSSFTIAASGVGSTYTSNTGTWVDTNISIANQHPREVGLVDSTGAYNTSTTLGNSFPGVAIFGAASPDGNSIYAAGGNDIVYTTAGSNTSGVSLASTGGTTGETYDVEINNGQLYSSGYNGSVVLATDGTGLPTTSGQSISELPGVTYGSFSAANGTIGYSREFTFATLNTSGGSTTPDTIYTADTYNDDVDKLSLVNGNWVYTGSIGYYKTGQPLTGITGIVAEPTPAGEQLFVTTSNAGGTGISTLFTITDPYGYDSNGGTAGTSAGGVFSTSPPLITLATAPTNEAFRGIAFAPQASGSLPIMNQPSAQTTVIGTNVSFFAAVAPGTSESVQWQVKTSPSGTWSNVSNGAQYSGANTNTLTVLNPTLDETGYQYQAVFTNSSATTTSSAATLTVTTGPEITLTASTALVPSSNGMITIDVHRAGDLTGVDTVQYATGGGTAVAGTNYTAESGTITFPGDGTTTDIIFNVPISYVSSQTSQKTFNVTLSSLTGTNAIYGIETETVAITVPTETLNFSSATYSVDTTNSDAIVSLIRAGTNSDAGSVPYTVTGTGGASSLSTTGTANLVAGQVVSPISIPLNGATSGTLTVSFGTASGFTTGGWLIGTTNTTTGTIVTAPSFNLSGSAVNVSSIQAAGYYSTTKGIVDGDTGAGTSSFSYLQYDLLDFTSTTTPNLYPIPGTTVNTSGVSSLQLQMNNLDASTDNFGGHVGNFDIYFINDTVTSTSTLNYNSSSVTGLLSSQFNSSRGQPVLIGQFSFDDAAGFEAYTANSLPSGVETQLVADLNSYAPFRLAVTPVYTGGGAIAVDWDGLDGSNTPILSLNAAQTVNQTPEYISFQSTTYSESETGPVATITLQRNGSNIGDTASVHYNTSDGTAVAGVNYTATSGIANFSAGSATTTFTIPVTSVPNQIGDQIVNLTLSSPLTGTPASTIGVLGYNGVLGSQSTATLDITPTIPSESLATTAYDGADIEAPGFYTDTYLKVAGPSASFPSYSPVDFQLPAPSSTVTATGTVTLTFTNYSSETAGPVDFYLVADTATVVDSSTTTHFYDSSQGTEGVGSQFGVKYLLGSYNLTDTKSGDVVTIPLSNYGPDAEAALISYLNSGSLFRIVATPESAKVSVEWTTVSAGISIAAQEATDVSSSSLPGWLAPGSSAIWSASTNSLSLTGSATITGNPAAYGNSGVIITGNGTSAVLSVDVPDNTNVQIGGLGLTNGATATLNGSTGAVLATNGLFVDTISSLDIGDGYLDVAGDTYANVSSELLQNYQAGVWSGMTGIISSKAESGASSLTTLGIIQNNGSGTALFTASNPFGGANGVTPGLGDILVRYTYYGDANLSGAVDGSDYSRIDNGYLTHLTGWANGDFNYDGVVNGSDYTLIDNAFNTQGAANPQAQIAPSTKPTANAAVSNFTAAVTNSFDSLFSKKKVSSSLIDQVQDLIAGN
jgi:hypothetical protein